MDGLLERTRQHRKGMGLIRSLEGPSEPERFRGSVRRAPEGSRPRGKNLDAWAKGVTDGSAVR
jgi:hypothetical protein